MNKVILMGRLTRDPEVIILCHVSYLLLVSGPRLQREQGIYISRTYILARTPSKIKQIQKIFSHINRVFDKTRGRGQSECCRKSKSSDREIRWPDHKCG